MENLGILEVQVAHISLEMADKTMKKPYGLVEDVLVKVKNHYILANFIVLDIGEDEDDCVIIQRSFLATAKALINVAKGEMVFQLREDYILFKISNPNFPSNKKEIIVQHLVCQPSLSMQSSAEPQTSILSLVLGSPQQALSTKKWEVTLRVNEDDFVLNAVKAMQHPDTPKECMSIDIIDSLVEEVNIVKRLEEKLDDIFMMPSLTWRRQKKGRRP
ncbi:uncharacterized protein LOC107466729 [Arachis duranensis]|uniref:Uncharacterized protein LOC107466729 n=1 Tax=Arachis duranensis TaxID=130453 RepID=A0A6P4BPX6_ARADU|nr:uncharacterized protein LOC107466729 [Arachis duranensis]